MTLLYYGIIFTVFFLAILAVSIYPRHPLNLSFGTFFSIDNYLEAIQISKLWAELFGIEMLTKRHSHMGNKQN